MRLIRRKARQALALLVVMVVLTSCGNWRGIGNVPLPGGPGSGAGSYTIYVQMPNTLALNGNSRVLVADVFVGTVRAITLKNWVATLTIDLEKGVRLPKNATAKIGQTSLLGSQHVELAAPANPSPQLLKNGDTIPLTNSSAYPTIEQTLASLAMVLRGGGIPNLEVIQNELYNIGRARQIRDFLGKLDTFINQLNQQRDDITHAIGQQPVGGVDGVGNVVALLVELVDKGVQLAKEIAGLAGAPDVVQLVLDHLEVRDAAAAQHQGQAGQCLLNGRVRRRILQRNGVAVFQQLRRRVRRRGQLHVLRTQAGWSARSWRWRSSGAGRPSPGPRSAWRPSFSR